MKTKLSIFIGLLVVLAFVIPGVTATGNDAMSGKHYNLNLISIKNIDQLPAKDEGNNGNRIFVNFQGQSRILLQQNTDGIFNVIDYIASRNDPASFTLPAPENEYVNGVYDGPGAYMVFVRVVGTPGGSGTLQTCYVEEGVEYCPLPGDPAIIPLYKSSKFRDVTKVLTTVTIDGVTSDIFSDEYKDYLWMYDNNGLKNVQLRFYPI